MSPKSYSWCAVWLTSPKRYFQTLWYSQYLKRMLNLMVLDDRCVWDLTIQYILFNVRGASGFEWLYPFLSWCFGGSLWDSSPKGHDGWMSHASSIKAYAWSPTARSKNVRSNLPQTSSTICYSVPQWHGSPLWELGESDYTYFSVLIEADLNWVLDHWLWMFWIIWVPGLNVERRHQQRGLE